MTVHDMKHAASDSGRLEAVGGRLSRVDGPAKITGAAKYAFEQQLEGLVHAVLVGATIASIFGRLGRQTMAGVHIERGDEIRIEGERSSVILDGELFEARAGFPIVLTPTAPVPFLSLAA